MDNEDKEPPPSQEETPEFSVSGYTTTPKGKVGKEGPALFRESEGEDFSQRYDTKKLYLGIQRHLWAIALSILLWGALGAVATWYFLTHYRAEAVLIYQQDLPKTLPGGISMNNLSLATAMDLITLPSHFQAVKSILGLNLTPKQIEDMVEVPVPRFNSHLIRILCKSDNPNLAVDIVNTLAQISVKGSVEFTQKQLQAQLDNFKNQLVEANQKLVKELKDIEDFKKAHQYFEMTADYTTLINQILEARANFQTATMRYNSLVIEYENLKRESGNVPSETGIHGGVTPATRENPYLTRIYAVEANLAEARARYTSSNPKVRALEEELKSLQEQAKGAKKEDGTFSPYVEANPNKESLAIELMRMQGKVRSAQKMKQDLSTSLAQMEKQMENLPAEQITFSKLLDAKKITEEQIQFLTKALETIQLMNNVPKGSLELYQLAEKAKPLRDAWWVNILPLLGALGGFLFGLIWAVGLEITDKKIWTPKQVELVYAIPALTVIPELTHLNKKNSEKKTLFYIRDLAEHLEYLELTFAETTGSDQHLGLILAFISSMAGEGKSCLAYHLALYYQRFQKKVLLIEFDPRPNSYSDETPSTSLEAYLRLEKKWQDLVIKGKPDRIKLGVEEPFMKELIKTRRVKELMNALKSEYELIIFDVPGIIDEDYAINLAAIADLCVFVIGSSLVNRSTINQSLEALYRFGVKPCGIILNRVLPVYIEDNKIKQEIKKSSSYFWEKLFFWR